MKKGILTKISLLLAASIAGTAAAINGNIPAMAEAFSTMHISRVELLATIPSFFLIISTLLSGFIANKVGYKKTMLIGIGIDAICGVLPAITHNFYLILASRALFGFGTGLFYSLLVGIISYLYQGEERARLIGLQGGFQGVGGVIVTFVSGQLLIMGWQASFWAYAVIFPVILLFALFVPDIPADKILQTRSLPRDTSDNDDENYTVTTKDKNRSIRTVSFYTLFLFVVATLYMIFGIKVTTLMKSSGYGVDSDGSTVIVLLCIGSIIGGAVFSSFLKHLKKFTLIVGLLILAVAMFLTGLSESVFITASAGMLAGFSTKIIMPYLLNNLNDGRIRNNVLATSVLLAGYNLGLTLSPYTSILIENLPGVQSLTGIFYANGIILLIIAVILSSYLIKKAQRSVKSY